MNEDLEFDARKVFEALKKDATLTQRMFPISSKDFRKGRKDQYA